MRRSGSARDASARTLHGGIREGGSSWPLKAIEEPPSRRSRHGTSSLECPPHDGEGGAVDGTDEWRQRQGGIQVGGRQGTAAVGQGRAVLKAVPEEAQRHGANSAPVAAARRVVVHEFVSVAHAAAHVTHRDGAGGLQVRDHIGIVPLAPIPTWAVARLIVDEERSAVSKHVRRGISRYSSDERVWKAVASTISAEAWPGEQAFPPFMKRALSMPCPRILELGTLQAVPGRSTRKQHLFPNACEYVGSDIEPGTDVDLVADVHRLTQYAGESAFDIIFTEAGFEHFKYPHLAAHEIMKCLRLGGLVFVQTHQTFPIHAVPHDYFRFSRDALQSLFSRSMGMRVHASGYGSPAVIYSRVDRYGHHAPAFLHANVFAEKVAPTPSAYVYEFDCLV